MTSSTFHPSEALDDANELGAPIFGTLDDVAALARPIGIHRAKKIFSEHPQAPRPVLGGGAPGTKAIHSMRKARAFWELVAEQGLATH